MIFLGGTGDLKKPKSRNHNLFPVQNDFSWPSKTIHFESFWYRKRLRFRDLDRFPLLSSPLARQEKITGPSVLLHEIDFYTFYWILIFNLRCRP